MKRDDITALEKKYWEAMAAHDYETVKSLTKFPCITAGKRGVLHLNEPDYRKMFEQGTDSRLKIKDISDQQVEVGENYATIAYLITLDYDGVDMKCACTSTWVKESENWKCAMHTESDIEEETN